MRTRFCDLLGIMHPIVQAGMAREYTSPELVAAVSAAGGLGILGCYGRPADEAVAAIRRIRALTDRPFGVNIVLHVPHEETFAACLAEHVPVFSFFRGDPAPAVARAHAAGALTLHQITTIAEAEQACAAAADVIVAQGHEAGGHMGPHSLWSFLPSVIALAGERPVLAAGGIVDGHGLAAALSLGASGALMGTRFLATVECPASDGYKHALVAATDTPDATIADSLFDILWGVDWPGIQVRSLRNALTERWAGRESELRAARDEVNAQIHQAETVDDPEGYAVLAGMGVGRIHDICPAGDLVRAIAGESEHILRALANRS